MAIESVADTQRSTRLPIPATRRQCKQFKKCLHVAQESQFDKEQEKVGSHTQRTMLKKELKWHAWKPHHCQLLSIEDGNFHMEF